MVKLNDRLNTLQSQYQPRQPAPPPASSSRSSLNRQLPPTIPSRHSPSPNWSNQDFQEPEFPINNLPSTMPDRPRLKDYLAAMKPDTWGSNTGRSSKRASAKREENMYLPPPVSNITDNSNFYSNAAPSTAGLYSTVSSTGGPTLTSLPTFNPRHYQVPSPLHSEQPSSFVPQHSLPYQQQKYNQLHSNDPASTLLAQNPGGQPQGIYNPHNTQQFPQHQQFHPSQPIYQPNPSAQQAFHQPNSSQQSVRQPPTTHQLGYQPSPSQQPVYQPPPPQQPVYQSHPYQQPAYQPPPPQQPTYQPPPPQQPTYQPSPPQQPTYQPPTPQQQVYQPPPPQQPAYQPSPPQQQVYQPTPPQQQVYQPPPPQQPTYQPPPPQQQVYQPPPPQQPAYQPSSFPQPMYQPTSTQQPTHPSFLQQPPQSQQINQHQISQSPQPNPTQQPLPPEKFDPYRPRPVGAYDIPKSQNPPVVSSPPPQQQTIPTQPRVSPQDVYRPGGLLSTNQPQVPSLSTNNNNYDPNQFVQYVHPSPTPPPPPPLVPTPSSAPTLPKNAVSTQPYMPTIADDLLSLALEQQIESSIINTEPNSPELQSTISIDEELQQKCNGKPIACIQPLSVVIEEKQPTQSLVTPVTSLSPPQDPYGDKDKLDQLESDVQRFEKHVSTMTKKILNGTVPLEVEWKVRIY